MRMVGRGFMAEIEDRKAGLTSRIIIESSEPVVVLASTRLEISGGGSWTMSKSFGDMADSITWDSAGEV